MDSYERDYDRRCIDARVKAIRRSIVGAACFLGMAVLVAGILIAAALRGTH